jgi:hypothetical protein
VKRLIFILLFALACATTAAHGQGATPQYLPANGCTTTAGVVNCPNGLGLGLSNTLNPYTLVSGVWRRAGIILPGTSACQYVTQEASIMVEPPLMEVWYTCGWSSTHINYAFANLSSNLADPASWTIASTGVPADHSRMMKDLSGIYHIYGTDSSTGNGYKFGRWTSSSPGGPFTQDGTNMLPAGIQPSWCASQGDGGQTGNIRVWQTASNAWHAYFDCFGGTVPNWRAGEAESTDGVTWTPYSGNPIFETGLIGEFGGVDLHIVNGTYYTWGTASPSGFAPTSIMLQSSASITGPFTPVFGRPVFEAQLPWEGAGTPSGGQLGDFSIAEYNGSSYAVVDGTAAQGTPDSSSPNSIELVVAPMTITQVLNTPQGTGYPMGADGPLDNGPFGWAGPHWWADSVRNHGPVGTSAPVFDIHGSFDTGLVTLYQGLYCFNCYWDGAAGTFRYTTTGPAFQFGQSTGPGGFVGLSFAPSGTAGTAFVFAASQAFAVDVNGTFFTKNVAVNAPATATAASPNIARLVDNNGTAQLLSYGQDTSTNGAFKLTSQRSDGTSSFDFMSCPSTTTPCAVKPGIAPSLLLGGQTLTFTVLANAGSGATAACDIADGAVCTNVDGVVKFVTGTSATTGDMFRLNLPSAGVGTFNCIYQNISSGVAFTQDGSIFSTSASTTFATSPASSATLKIIYHCGN